MPLRSERRFIAKDKIQSGMMLEFSYKKIKDDSNDTYMVLVIDPDKDSYLHALKIDDLSDTELIGLITKLGSFTYDPDNRKNPITNLQNDEAYNKYTGIKSDRRYRTFLKNNIVNPRQILLGNVT